MTTTTPLSSGDLTVRQTEVLQVIRSHIETTGAPPTRAEIAKKLGFKSVNAAEDHLKALARKGAIVLSPGTSRGIQLSEKHGLGLPVIKQYTADKPIFQERNFDGRLRIQHELFNQRPDYLLEMKGLGLTGAGIKDGDLIAVHATQQAVHGRIVIARVNGKVEIRRYLLENGQVILKADHPDFQDIRLQSPHQLVIEGIAVGVIRTASI